MNVITISEIIKMHGINFFYMRKSVKVSAETYEKIGINTIIVNNENNKPVIWLKMHDI